MKSQGSFHPFTTPLSGAVLSLALSAEGDFCYSGGADGTIRIWRVPEEGYNATEAYEPALENTLTGHGGAVVALALVSEHTLIAATADGTCATWDTMDGSCVAEWPGPEEATVTCLRVRERIVGHS